MTVPAESRAETPYGRRRTPSAPSHPGPAASSRPPPGPGTRATAAPRGARVGACSLTRHEGDVVALLEGRAFAPQHVPAIARELLLHGARVREAPGIGGDRHRRDRPAGLGILARLT